MMTEFFLYLFVIGVSTGFVYNSFGNKIILLLLVSVFIVVRKVKISYKFLICASLFLLFIGIKGFGGGIEVSNNYHGLWSVYTRIIELVIAFIVFYSLKCEKRVRNHYIIKKCRILFNVCYYCTLLVTIVYLLNFGIGYYRNYEMDNLLCAPQFFIFYAIIFSMELISKIIVQNERRSRNILLLVINATFIVAMNYTTQMIFLFFGLSLIILVRVGKKRRRIVLLIGGILSMVIICFPFLPQVLEMINIRFFSNNLDVSMRLNELAAFLSQGSLSGKALGGRVDIMRISLKSFINNPIFGVTFNNYNKGSLIVGGHHEWIDDLARFGLVGMFLFLSFVYYGIKESIMKDDENSCVYYSIIITFMIYGFFNPFLNITFVIPLFIWSWLISKPDKENAKSHL